MRGAVTAAVLAGLAAAGCAQIGARSAGPQVEARAAGPETPRPAARPGSGASGALPVATGARTAAAFDTVTPQERAAAMRPAAGGRALGETVASLGPPGETGLWLRTGLVTAPTPGRVTHAPSGASVRVELRPSGGPATAGSQLSLSAYLALGLNLTDLPRLQVAAD